MSFPPSLLQALHIKYPIFLSPMAGTGTVELAAAVSNAGGLGGLAIGAMSPLAAREAIWALRRLTKQPFNINVFTHQPARRDPVGEACWLSYLTPHFKAFDASAPTSLGLLYSSFVENNEMLDVLLEARPSVVSFHFGLPRREQIVALHGVGSMLFATATSVDEALAIEAAGIDAIVAQGIEAGGHRGMFDPLARDEALSTLALVSEITRRTTLPVIAAGGIMNGGDIAAMLAAGAQAAQLGTAFISTPESAADAAYRAALGNPTNRTMLMSVISGRPARGIENRFAAMERDPQRPPVPAYPVAYDAGKALHAVAKSQGDTRYAAQWAGQGFALSRTLSAVQLVETLVSELHDAQGAPPC